MPFLETTLQNSRIFSGIPLSPGKIAGEICLYGPEYHKSVPEYIIKKNETQREIERFENARQQCVRDIEKITDKVAKNVGKAEAEIFFAQKLMLEDPDLIQQITVGIKQYLKNAEYIVSDVFKKHEENFLRIKSDFIRERASDLADIRIQLIDRLRKIDPRFLCKGHPNCTLGKNRIIAANELSPLIIANLEISRVTGFITEHGGFTSHGAIIARSLGVPAVSGIHGLLDQLECGTHVLVDGDMGKVYLEPEQKFAESILELRQRKFDAKVSITTPTGMEVLANAGMKDEIELAERFSADGIGLFRTEYIFIKSNKLLDEFEQFEYYSTVIKQMKGKPVTFRLVDVGGDKPLPFIKIENEANPYLGYRGSRFLLGNPDIYSTQLKALAKASRFGKINILFPMIIDVFQLKELLLKKDKILSTIDYDPENLKFGAMFEVPSASIQADNIFEIVDFGSIGSNDLIQYLFAVDRNNEHVSSDYNPDHPVLWHLLKQISETAKKAFKPLSICGEMAGIPGMVSRFLDIGITSLSVSPRLIPIVRNDMIAYANKHKA